MPSTPTPSPLPSVRQIDATRPIEWLALGLRDINQNRHTVLRNFPVLGNIRYVLETIRPEIRQYFVEGARALKPPEPHAAHQGRPPLIAERCSKQAPP